MKGKALLSIGFVYMMLFCGCSKAENNISTSKNKPADVTREAIGPWNRVQQFQPFPEIVDVKDNGDGTYRIPRYRARREY